MGRYGPYAEFDVTVVRRTCPYSFITGGKAKRKNSGKKPRGPPCTVQRCDAEKPPAVQVFILSCRTLPPLSERGTSVYRGRAKFPWFADSSDRLGLHPVDERARRVDVGQLKPTLRENILPLRRSSLLRLSKCRHHLRAVKVDTRDTKGQSARGHQKKRRTGRQIPCAPPGDPCFRT